MKKNPDQVNILIVDDEPRNLSVLESILDDLRVRGDRQQLYWHRLAIE